MIAEISKEMHNNVKGINDFDRSWMVGGNVIGGNEGEERSKVDEAIIA